MQITKQQLQTYSNYLVQWIQEQVQKANFSGVVFGLSGGVDSAVIAALAKRAFPQTALGLIMPVGAMGQDRADARTIARTLQLPVQELDLTAPFVAMSKITKVTNALALANIKPRLRMTALYAFAKEHRYLVLGTDNAAEWLLGYFTKHGDGAADLLPLVHLPKSAVLQLAELLGLPNFLVKKAPSAGLWPGQTDEAELGLRYADVDAYLRGAAIKEEVAAQIKVYARRANHKKRGALMPDGPEHL